MENDTVEQARASTEHFEMGIWEKLEKRYCSMSFKQNSSECCIYRVRKPLRDVNSEAYTPQLISIGPFHSGNKTLEAMEEKKMEYFKKLSEREVMDKKKKCDIEISIKNQEKRLRYCYSEKFEEIKSNDFVEMILLDAVFLIQFFLESKDDTDGPKHFDIPEDLMLLENQLPLFIIQEIYDQVSYHSSDNKDKSFLDLATLYLRKCLHLQVVETSPGVDLQRNLMLCKTSQGVEKETSPGVKKETSSDVEGSRHLTDLLRNLMLSSAIQRTYRPVVVKLKYSAVMLRKAGVRFQVIRDECLVNITFDKKVLKIPQLEVDDNFERLVRNIMAMEQCLYKREAYICSYIKFMDHLIHSAEDVGLLVENGIILHCLDDDAAVSKMIHNLCKNIGDNYTCFGDISIELNIHYGYRWNHVKYIFFRNMWRGTGTISGAIMLILTFIQTISSVKSLL